MTDVAVTGLAVMAVVLMVFEILPCIGDDCESWFAKAEYVLHAGLHPMPISGA
jgi:hypothetical protein